MRVEMPPGGCAPVVKTSLDGMAAVPKRAEHTHTLTGAPFEDSIWQ